MLRDVPQQPTDAIDQDIVLEARSQLGDALERVRGVLSNVVDAAGPARGPLGHLVGARGKMLRPRLVLLASAVASGEPRFSPELAAAAELIHTASLLHDDVIDDGAVRRGLPSVRVVWSNTASVLAGDHCLTDAVDLVRSVDTGETLAEALACVRNLVDGELLQMETRGEFSLDEARYRRVCELKTASLFVWSARAGARWAGGSTAEIDALGEFAANLGTAFQIRDDLLDFVGTEGFGKRLLDDLREGRSTLPLIVAAQRDDSLREAIAELFVEHDAPDFERRAAEIAHAVRTTGAADEVAAEVNSRIDVASKRLRELPESRFRALLAAQIGALGANTS